MADLLPCPFCGSAAERVDFETVGSALGGDPNAGGSCICCKQCGASSPVHFDRKENLFDSWNRRTTEQPPQIVIDAYLGISVLRTMCMKARLTGGQEASDQLIGRMEEEYPALPALSALRHRT